MKIPLVVLALFLALPSLEAAVFRRSSRTTYQKPSHYADGRSLRQNNRVGVGLNVAGVSGSAGLQMEFNFTPDTGLVTGFGFGGGYQSFHAAYKRVIGGSKFLPYMMFGYTRWYTAAKDVRTFESTKPSLLADKFLNEEERKGSFDEHFIFPGVGIQFLQLAGDYVGTSVHMDLVLMIDIDDFLMGPLGSFGMTYYF